MFLFPLFLKSLLQTLAAEYWSYSSSLQSVSLSFTSRMHFWSKSAALAVLWLILGGSFWA